MTTTVRFWLDHTDVGKEGRWKMFSTGSPQPFLSGLQDNLITTAVHKTVVILTSTRTRERGMTVVAPRGFG